jgi:hypothetical protein
VRCWMYCLLYFSLKEILVVYWGAKKLSMLPLRCT